MHNVTTLQRYRCQFWSSVDAQIRPKNNRSWLILAVGSWRRRLAWIHDFRASGLVLAASCFALLSCTLGDGSFALAPRLRWSLCCTESSDVQPEHSVFPRAYSPSQNTARIRVKNVRARLANRVYVVRPGEHLLLQELLQDRFRHIVLTPSPFPFRS